MGKGEISGNVGRMTWIFFLPFLPPLNPVRKQQQHKTCVFSPRPPCSPYECRPRYHGDTLERRQPSATPGDTLTPIYFQGHAHRGRRIRGTADAPRTPSAVFAIPLLSKARRLRAGSKTRVARLSGRSVFASRAGRERLWRERISSYASRMSELCSRMSGVDEIGPSARRRPSPLSRLFKVTIHIVLNAT